MTSNSTETAKEIALHFFSDDSLETDTIDQQEIRKQNDTYPDTANAPPFSEEEVKDAAQSFPKKKCPGHDHLNSEFCSKIIAENLSYCCKVSNKCLELE